MSHEINNPSIKRLAILAGLKEVRISNDVYNVIRLWIHEQLMDLLKNAVSVAQHAHRKTLYLKDLQYAIEEKGKKLYGDKDTVFKGCRSPKQIKKTSADCVVIAKRSFIRLVRKIVEELVEKSRVSPGFIENLQYLIEHETVGLLQRAYHLTTVIGGRKTLSKIDVQTAATCK